MKEARELKKEKKMKKIENQHGDLLLEIVDRIPSGAKRLKVESGFVLERGEGIHTHIFPDVSGIEVFEKDGETYVRVSKKTQLDHEEHGKQTVMPGVYRKRIERVFDYEKLEARNVID